MIRKLLNFLQQEIQRIFQFESSGMRNVLKQVKPTSFEDIVATNALLDQVQWIIFRIRKRNKVR